MTCEEARDDLPSFVSDGLAPEHRLALQSHLEGCPACTQEATALAGVSQMLRRTVAAPVHVAVGTLEREALRRQLRRWRRTAQAAGALAALFLALLLSPLTFQIERHQLVVRWGDPPAVPLPEAPPAPPAHDEERLLALEALTRALIVDLQTLDVRQSEQLALIRNRLEALTRRPSERIESNTRDLQDILTRFPELKGDLP